MSAEIENVIQLDNGYRITYLYHSGYMVESPEATYVFDYYRGELPEIRKEKPFYVFVSHKHGDHFNFDIFQWSKCYDVQYILSADIGKKYKKKYFIEKKGIDRELYESFLFLEANQVWEDSWIRVRTIDSTDIGVAFLVKNKLDDRLIYHAGDLNWWTWEGENDEEYQKMTGKFKGCIAQLKQCVYDEDKKQIEIAFLPLDPRQERRYSLGFDYYMRKLSVEYVFPMHAFGDHSVIGRFMRDDVSAPYRHKIINICGDNKKKLKIPDQDIKHQIQNLLQPGGNDE